MVFWPDVQLVSNSIEISASVDNRVFCYSHYKKGFTAEVLLGITQVGLIYQTSKALGGRKSVALVDKGKY